MISKGLFNFAIYRLFQSLYENYKNNKRFKQYLLNNNNVGKNISRTYTKENRQFKQY
jgi:hypothetical protein